MSELGIIDLGIARVRSVRQDGVIVWKVKCPRCLTWGEVDDDQWNGRVSLKCGERFLHRPCNWHETVNFKALLDAKVAELGERERAGSSDTGGGEK